MCLLGTEDERWGWPQPTNPAARRISVKIVNNGLTGSFIINTQSPLFDYLKTTIATPAWAGNHTLSPIVLYSSAKIKFFLDFLIF